MESIQFVFQDESVEVGDIASPPDIETCLPTFDLDGWPSGRYSDAHLSVMTAKLPSGELYATIGDAHPSRSVSVGRGLRFDFDTYDQLVGIALGPLTADEWRLVKASAPLDDGR